MSNFTNVGVRHTTLKDGSIEQDQEEYVKSLQPIVSPDMIGKNGDDLATEPLQLAYMSLLGAIAYALLTCWHLSVYVVALQRKSQKACYIHIRRLNALVRYAQKTPRRLQYVAMTC